MPIVYKHDNAPRVCKTQKHHTISPNEIKEIQISNQQTEEFLQACVDNWPTPQREKEIAEKAHQRISDLIQDVQKMKNTIKTKEMPYKKPMEERKLAHQAIKSRISAKRAIKKDPKITQPPVKHTIL